MVNLFRQAKQLIETKNCGELTDKDTVLINRALFLAICLLPRAEPLYDQLPISDALEELAEIVEGGKK